MKRKGFFSRIELELIKPKSNLLIPKCGACKLNLSCKSPKMKVFGKGQKGVLLVGESPGEMEDLQGRPFVGPAGQRLQRTLRKLGIDMRRDCWVTNSAICRPKNNLLEDKVIDYCRPNLLNTIKELSTKLKVVILLGASAVSSLIGDVWKEDTGGIFRWAGFKIPYQKGNYWICPTYHPSHVLREDNKVVDMYFEKHLEEAFKIQEKPWEEVPDYRKDIKVILDDSEASDDIKNISDGMVSFDFETNMLKPDSRSARIVCCSICHNGDRTIAFPWYGKSIETTKALLSSKIPKIGWNLSFEDRWTRKRLKTRIRNWKWDGMLASHVLDCRKFISSLKFQAFVVLGFDLWNRHIEPFFEPKKPGCNEVNRIDEVDLNQLLIYCGIDSLLEYKIGIIQMKDMGYGS